MELTTENWINLLNILLAGFPTLFVAYLAFVNSKNTTRIAKYNNQIYSDELLFNVRKNSRDLMIKIAESKNEQNETIILLYKQSIEDVLNAYELACSLYLDDAIDKERFKKLRIREIRALKENKDLKGNFTYPQLQHDSHPFRAIQKVYEEFRDKE